MVDRQGDNNELVVSGAEGGGIDLASECEDYSSDESTVTIEDDEDLTTDGDGGRAVALATTPQEVPTFGSVSVNNSTDIHFGNKTVYQGPVTIKQFVYANGKEPYGAVDDALPEGVKVEGIDVHPRSLPHDVTQVPKGNQDLGRRDALKMCIGEASKRRLCFVWIALLSVAVLVAALTLILVLVSSSDKDAADKSKLYRGEAFYNQPRTKYDVTLSGKLRILDRQDWLAQPPLVPLDTLTHPVPYVIISHTATEACHSQAQCVFRVRTAQTFHIESKGWSDIGYNFLVGGDGYVYMGRGWDYVGAHAYGYNACSIGISFIGTFLTEHPKSAQFEAAMQLIEEGVRLGKISKEYKLLGHRQVSATESPGQALFDDIKVLPHWLKTPVSCAQANNATLTSDQNQNKNITL